MQQPHIILIFSIIPLLIAILIVHPIMFLNDEWITANQLHQLSYGSQILYNEGKYGTYENGTIFTYFEIRGNSLPYTSYLPIVSLPFLWAISITGNHLPYLITIIWISLALFLFFYLRESPHHGSNFFKKKESTILLSGIFLFFILNLIFYNQLSISDETDWYEILGVVIYHLCIYSLLSIVIYLINRNLFLYQNEVFFGTVTSLCCSSALFWTTTLKDHLDVMFFGAILILSIILHIKTRNSWYGIITFIISGLIFWIRPEYGAFVFISLLLIFWPMILITNHTKKEKDLFLLLISPCTAFFGSLPLFLNNYLVMGNPLKFPWQMASSYVIVNDEASTSTMQTTFSIGGLEYGDSIFHNILSLFIHRMTPDGDVISGILSVFFYPELQKIPIFGLIPIFFLSVLLLPILIIYLKKNFKREEIQIIVILASLSICTIIAYISSISSLGTSSGIYPDVRYLSPLYLPLTLIGLIIMMKFEIPQPILTSIIKKIGQLTLLGVTILLIIITILHPLHDYSDFFFWMNVVNTILVFFTLGFTFVTFSLSIIGKVSDRYWNLTLSLLIALPFIWQISQLIIINYSFHLFNEYPSLLPAIRAFFDFLTGNVIR